MTTSDKPNNLFAHAQLQNSVNKALNTKKELTQTSNETKWWSFDESLAGCLENIIKGDSNPDNFYNLYERS